MCRIRQILLLSFVSRGVTHCRSLGQMIVEPLAIPSYLLSRQGTNISMNFCSPLTVPNLAIAMIFLVYQSLLFQSTGLA